jgi:hypothetical protein
LIESHRRNTLAEKHREVALQYQISGLHQNQLWIIYATNIETAEHMAALFRSQGYTNVKIKEQEPI